jgi:hypothetical protein
LREILGERAWTGWWNLTWGKDELEPGERRADANQRRAGEGQADRDGTSYGATAEPTRDELRYRGTSRAITAILSNRAPAVGTEIRG